MTARIILASGSETRAAMLRNAGLDVTVERPRVDEDAIKQAMVADGTDPRDLADALAEAKARKVGGRHPGDLVLGGDQVLDLDGEALSKPPTPQAAIDQLTRLSDRQHRLLSAAVVFHDGRPVWRHVGTARLTMRRLSPGFIESYVARNWDTIRYSVGGYRIEEEGVRLFSQVEGDHFTILGLPLIPLLSWLVVRGSLET